MTSAKFIATAKRHWNEIEFEFGRAQANMEISSNGLAARKLKLETGDKVEITIRKLPRK